MDQAGEPVPDAMVEVWQADRPLPKRLRLGSIGLRCRGPLYVRHREARPGRRRFRGSSKLRT